jgi:DNA primase
LYKAYDYIKQKGSVIVCESEKGVLQLWSQGYRNSVSIGGHSFSKTQIEKITRLNANVVIAFDKDVPEEEVLKECARFMDCINIQYIIDKNEILDEKESPMDNRLKFFKLFNDNKYSYVKG